MEASAGIPRGIELMDSAHPRAGVVVPLHVMRGAVGIVRWLGARYSAEVVDAEHVRASLNTTCRWIASPCLHARREDKAMCDARIVARVVRNSVRIDIGLGCL